MQNYAKRLAERLLKDHPGSDGFEVEVDEEILHLVASRLRELGCTVELDSGRHRLLVLCAQN